MKLHTLLLAVALLLGACASKSQSDASDASTKDVLADTGEMDSSNVDVSSDSGELDVEMDHLADDSFEIGEVADTIPSPREELLTILGEFGADYPEIVDAFLSIPDLADGLTVDEEDHVLAVVSIWLSLSSEDWERVRPWFQDRPASPPVDDGEFGLDGVPDEWLDLALEAPDRPGDAGTPAVDILDAAFLDGEQALWATGTLAEGCSEDAGFMILLDHDRGLHYDTEVMGYFQGGAKATTARYRVDEFAAQSLDYSLVEWECTGDTFEVKIPWSLIDGYQRKPATQVWFFTFDMGGTLSAPLFDISPAVLLEVGDYPGATEDLYRLVEGSQKCIEDPAVTVAVALQNRFWRDVSQPELVPRIVADGIGWVEYAAELPTWQQMYNIPYDFSQLPFDAKMTWASRIQQSLVFGSFAIYERFELLNEEQYDFVSLTAEDLKWYRQKLLEVVELSDDLNVFVGNVDDWMWHKMRYCAEPDQMEKWCADGTLSDVVCVLWENDKAEGNLTLGTVDGFDVPNHNGVSASFQKWLFGERGYFEGDCRTHCLVTNTFYRSAGLAVTGWQYYPDDETVGRAIHELPIYFNHDTGRWVAYQYPDHITPTTALAHIWYFLPVRDPRAFPMYHVDFDKVSSFQGFQTFMGITFQQMLDTLSTGMTYDFWVKAFWSRYPDTVMDWSEGTP